MSTVVDEEENVSGAMYGVKFELEFNRDLSPSCSRLSVSVVNAINL